MFRPNSAIFRLEIQCQKKNYLSDLNVGVQGRGRDLVYKMELAAEMVLAQVCVRLVSSFVGRLARGVGS